VVRNRRKNRVVAAAARGYRWSMKIRIEALSTDTAERIRRERRDDLGNQDLPVVVADDQPGFPCRHCLRDAEIGDEMILFTHAPLPARGAYWSAGPVFVHAAGCPRYAEVDRLPELVLGRLLSIRAYDRRQRIVEGELVPGADAMPVITSLLARPEVDHLLVHFARLGCYAFRVDRA
jgi:hypothetical protein